jgi:TP901 family phage tail tape measure protein
MLRVTDVMAKSFSSSALDLDKFAMSMKYVAPVAAAAGISLEEASAMFLFLQTMESKVHKQVHH